jgi:glucokinase
MTGRATTPPPGPGARYVLGLDVGGTKLAAGVVDPDGRVLSWLTEPTRLADGARGVIDRHVEQGREAVEAAGVGWDEIAAVGIGAGGPLDTERGILESPLNLPGWIDVPIVAIVESALGRPAVVENDATAAALAEYRYGAGRSRGSRHLVYLTISTGIGGGLVLDGRLYRGAAGNAGELGHLTIDWHGRPCTCGRRGCLEAYASGTNIAVRAREALESGEPSSLRSLPAITARDVAVAAAAGDAVATRVWDETTDILGSAVATILDVFNPDVIVLGGGVTRSGDQLLGPVREVAFRDAMAPAAESAAIVVSELGDQLGVIAAAAIAFERLGPFAGLADPASAAGAGTPRVAAGG